MIKIVPTTKSIKEVIKIVVQSTLCTSFFDLVFLFRLIGISPLSLITLQHATCALSRLFQNLLKNIIVFSSLQIYVNVLKQGSNQTCKKCAVNRKNLHTR